MKLGRPLYFVLLMSVICVTHADEAQPVDGAALFAAHCAVCHAADGAGNPSLAPPLIRYPARYVTSTEGRRHLILTLLNGMFGEISVDQARFDFRMPEFKNLSDVEIAGVLNYVAFDVSKAPSSAPKLAASDVAQERSSTLSGSAVREHRTSVLAELGLSP